jgi:class 3 adenylate cyclase/TolB-like protein/Tfp pilus assembly protein PilF
MPQGIYLLGIPIRFKKMAQNGRRLAAIMFADVVGYTALTQRDESFALQAIGRLRELTSPIFGKHGGRLVKMMGDGFLVEFQSAMDAVLCAVEVQHAMQLRNRESPDERIRLKIGVHVGDVIHEGGDVLGDAVNIASRIEPLADPGGVCISAQVFDQVKNKLNYAMEGMGPQNLKNVTTPVDTYRVLLPWAEDVTGSAPPLLHDRHRLAVLPLSSFSPDPNDEYFADGMMDEIITKLSGVHGLKVIARTSAMKYKGARKSVAEIGSELNVGTVLEGSVRKSGDRTRIALQLIDASTEEHIWASSYDRSLTDIFAVQTDIAENVTRSLEIRLMAKELEALRRPGTEDLQAYTHYLKGRESMSKRSEEEVREAKREFELAIEKDPTFARAYSGLADCMMILGNYGYAPAPDMYRSARPLVTKALELDPNLAEAHASMGLLLEELDYDWPGAELEFKKAIEINPGYASAHHWYSMVLADMAKIDEMLEEIRTALEFDPLSAAVTHAAAAQYYYAGQYSEALRLEERALTLSPGHPGAKYLYPLLLCELGRTEEAISKTEEWASAKPDSPDPLATLVWLLARSGKLEEARARLGKLEEMKRQGKATAGALWAPYVSLGDFDKAFEYAAQAIDDRELEPMVFRLSSGLDQMRSDPRYRALLKRCNIETP